MTTQYNSYYVWENETLAREHLKAAKAVHPEAEIAHVEDFLGTGTVRWVVRSILYREHLAGLANFVRSIEEVSP